MKKLRLSYTLLTYWDSNNLDDMIKFYFKTGETTIRPGMADGKKWDELNTKHVLDKNQLLPEFGGDPLKAPIPQLKLVADYNDFIEIVGCLDLYDTDTIFEFKTGVSMDSSDYANSDQLPFYFSLLYRHALPAEKAYIIHFNPQTRETDRTLLWNSEEMLNRFVDIVENKGKMIYKYFEENGLL